MIRRKCLQIFGSSLAGVIGRAFNVCSTRHIVVVNTSSVKDRFPRIDTIAFLQHLTNLSQTPSKCGAPGGLNFQTMFFWAKPDVISSLFQELIYSFNSLADPTKFVPLSLIIVAGFPLLAINRLIATKHESVSRLLTTSMCIALVVRQVNQQHQRFIVPLNSLTSNGPK